LRFRYISPVFHAGERVKSGRPTHRILSVPSSSGFLIKNLKVMFQREVWPVGGQTMEGWRFHYHFIEHPLWELFGRNDKMLHCNKILKAAFAWYRTNTVMI